MATDQVKLAERVGRVGAAMSSEQALGPPWPPQAQLLISPTQATVPPVAWEQVSDGQVGFWGEKQLPQNMWGQF